MQNRFDVIVVGAGAAGLMAAWEIGLTGRSVAVLEAKDRCGGRMHTIVSQNGMSIELGAEFIHGKLPITLDLLKKAGAKIYETGGAVWRKDANGLHKEKEMINDETGVVERMKALRQDLPLQQFVREELKADEQTRQTLLRYAEGYYAADPARLSTFAMREEMENGDDEQFRPEGGYAGLVDFLEKECRKQGVQFLLSIPVQEIEWTADGVVVKAGDRNFSAAKTLVTVSLGVLQSGRLNFSPALSGKVQAIQKLGYGHVQKIVLHFSKAFWKDKTYTHRKNTKKLGFLFSEEAVPTWWTHHPKDDGVITGWIGGPSANVSTTKSDLIEKGLQSLSCIFSISIEELKEVLLSSHHHNWSADEHFCGAYSYTVVDGERYINEVLEPVDNAIFFAGEGLHVGKEFGTVEAALHSGRAVAHRLIAGFPKP